MTARKLGSDRPANRGNAGKGRRKGIPNRFSGDLRAMILAALDSAGGADYLAEQARENPAAFLTLVGKAMPKQFTVPDDAAQLFSGVQIVLVQPDQRDRRVIEHE